MPNNKQYWETIYSNKSPHEVSWTQEVPETSLAFIRGFNLPLSAKIIDIGGGDSKLVDFLLREGYENITVLDISEKSIERAKTRLGDKANQVTWIVSDIVDFSPESDYDIWHDRAVFHFLTTRDQIEKYISIARNAIKGFLVIGTFSKNGPTKCSGLEIKQYNEVELENQLSEDFVKLRCITEDHITPFKTSQNFLFCSFKLLPH